MRRMPCVISGYIPTANGTALVWRAVVKRGDLWRGYQGKNQNIGSWVAATLRRAISQYCSEISMPM